MTSPKGSTVAYRRRVVDDELDELLEALPAINIDGPKGVGKTATASQRARTVFRLDDPAAVEVVAADPTRMTDAPGPVLIDEWQRYPYSWDLVRRAVDDGTTPGRFLLTGSTHPAAPPIHSGAARIVGVRLRPMTLLERGGDSPTVSLSTLLAGKPAVIAGATNVTLEDYVLAILTGGFPGMHASSARATRALLDSYLARIVDRDFPEAGRPVRNPRGLTRWLTAYAAATATTASFETIRDAATAGHGSKPARSTTVPYRDTLERIWIADPMPAWAPTRNHLRRLTSGPKHYLADPALAAALLDVDADLLLDGRRVGPPVPRDGTLLGSLFESLVALDLRVYAQAAQAVVGHLRTKNGDHEVDFIVQGRGRRIVALEVKLAATVGDADVRHLHWLAAQLGDELVDSVVVTTGRDAYRRTDGVAVVPASLLGP